jgi:hypothetical protein
MVYRTKISWGLWIPVFLMLTITGAFMVRDGAWPGLIVNLFVLFMIIHLLTNTYYEIEGDLLTIRSGIIYKKSIEVSRIRKITETNNPLSAPAASLDRLAIMYDKWTTVLISPENKEQFIAHMLQLNSAIEVRRKPQR